MDRTTLLRQLVLAVLRFAAVVFVLLALYSLAAVINVLLHLIEIDPAFRWMNFVQQQGAGRALWFIANLAAAALIWKYSGRLALWIVPRLSAECLRCGHRLEPGNGGVCPECGSRG
ncbi:MAG: hypothetical protein H7Y88_03475 [Phycisphaerales bacterium]|nr:hypothetical protein [Phycisphaerales bacterium]